MTPAFTARAAGIGPELGPAALRYLPEDPVSYRPGIGVIGCGAVSGTHLGSYRDAGYHVVALCDLDESRASARRDEFFPTADTGTDYRRMLDRDDIEVVDIPTHVEGRSAIIEAALRAGKHVLSQKPFVDDLDEGERLCGLADEVGRVLAVNQNGRWAPHHAYALAAVRAGLLGRVHAIDFALHWPHDRWVQDSPIFSAMEHLILWDFGIHWFDLVATLLASQGNGATRVFTSVGRRPGQLVPVASQAQVVIDADDAQASLVFRGSAATAQRGSYRVTGSGGSLLHTGDALGGTTVEVITSADDADDGSEEATTVELEGSWYENGMRGTMGELLRSIEEGRRPSNDARASLAGLALCFAAVEAGRVGRPLRPGEVRRLPGRGGD